MHAFSRHAGTPAATFRRALSPLRNRWRGATAPSGCPRRCSLRPTSKERTRPTSRRGCGAPATAFSPVSFAEAAGDDIPVLELLLAEGGAPESYRLDVARGKITVTAPDAAGLFYGLQSLGQLAEHCGRRIPAVVIEDAPRFGYRGFMLDVSRHFRDKEFVKRQLDLLARYKFNRFHWHLTDGAGWRIEIKKYPALTDIAAWRPYPDWEGWNFGGKRYCRRDDPAADGGYYTQDEIREVVEYARALHIEVIPEIEMPGHSEEVLAVFPRTFMQRETLCQLRLLHRQRTDVRIPRKRPFRGDRTLPLGVYPHRRRRSLEAGLAHLPQMRRADAQRGAERRR